MSNLNTRLLIFFVSILLATLCYGQDIPGMKLSNKQSILNDKAFFLFPEDAKNMARASDIMSADPNTNKETRIILDIDKQRLVFFAQELFVTADKNDLFTTVSKQNGAGFKTRILTDKDSLISVLSTPIKLDSTGNAILINSLIVKAQDNSVFVISAYINPDALKNKAQFQELSEKVFASLSKGTRKYNLEARIENFPIFESKKNFTINLPANFIVTKDKKYDFEVLRFEKIKDIADTSWTELTIYMGFHPSYFYGEYDLRETDAEKVRGKFLDKNVEWLSFKKTEEHFYLKEQKIQCDEIQQGLIIHIAMLGNQYSGIEELSKLTEKIRLTSK